MNKIAFNLNTLCIYHTLYVVLIDIHSFIQVFKKWYLPGVLKLNRKKSETLIYTEKICIVLPLLEIEQFV